MGADLLREMHTRQRKMDELDQQWLVVKLPRVNFQSGLHMRQMKMDETVLHTIRGWMAAFHQQWWVVSLLWMCPLWWAVCLQCWVVKNISLASMVVH